MAELEPSLQLLLPLLIPLLLPPPLLLLLLLSFFITSLFRLILTGVLWRGGELILIGEERELDNGVIRVAMSLLEVGGDTSVPASFCQIRLSFCRHLGKNLILVCDIFIPINYKKKYTNDTVTHNISYG